MLPPPYQLLVALLPLLRKFKSSWRIPQLKTTRQSPCYTWKIRFWKFCQCHTHRDIWLSADCTKGFWIVWSYGKVFDVSFSVAGLEKQKLHLEIVHLGEEMRPRNVLFLLLPMKRVKNQRQSNLARKMVRLLMTSKR